MARVSEKSRDTTLPRKKRAAAKPKLPGIVKIIQRLGRRIPEEELKRIPKDLLSQIDHYVYGTPKR